MKYFYIRRHFCKCHCSKLWCSQFEYSDIDMFSCFEIWPLTPCFVSSTESLQPFIEASDPINIWVYLVSSDLACCFIYHSFVPSLSVRNEFSLLSSCMLKFKGGIQKVRSLKITEFWSSPSPPLVHPCSFSSTLHLPSLQDTFVLGRTHPLPLNFYTCEI